MLTINQILQQGRYRIVNQLGQNGIGMGYEAFDNILNTNVLLKEITENLGKVTTAAQLEARKAIFAGKAKLLTGMKHDSLLHVNDFFSEVDRHYLVTEFIDGNTLGDLIEKKKSPFPLIDTLNWANDLLDALNYLHTMTPQIIHHEVKPPNIKLSPNGKIKLLVFNIFKSSEEQENSADSNQTFDAAVLPYLPLEQIWGGLDAASQKVILTNYDEKSERVLEQPLDARSDLYALGATLYHLLTARIPADALTRSIEILEGNDDPLQSPSQVNPSVPSEISEVLMKALEIKRENRFSSAVIMRQVLRTALVRVKEREAKMPKAEDDAMLEIPIVETKPMPPKAPPAAPKNPEIESEQIRQLELIKQQLREAEQRRLEAEQRAAEAEKRLLEAEKHITFEPVVESQPVVEAAQVAAFAPVTEDELADETNNQAASDYQDDDFSSLFAETQKESNVFKKVAAAVVVLIVLGGAAFGVWSMMQSKSTGTNQTISSSNTAVPAPSAEATPATTETAPASSYQASTETNNQPNGSPSAETNPASNPAATKIKAATPTPQQTAQVKKPTATPAKTTETQKKVTLDDLLKDN